MARLQRPLLGLALLLLIAACSPSLLWSANPKPRPSPCTVIHPSDAQVAWTCQRLNIGDTLEGLFGDRWVDVARFNRIDRRHAHAGVAIKVPLHLDDIAGFSPLPLLYPPADTEAKFVLVDQSEQFLSAYEFGLLAFSAPITTGAAGESGLETPTGEYHITAAHRSHRSSLYPIEGTDIPYPMDYALQFHISPKGVAFWIHGRDLPGIPASHGCIGLYNESMQRQYYGAPSDPLLEDAKILYEWVITPLADTGASMVLEQGPRLLIQGEDPMPLEHPLVIPDQPRPLP